MTRQQELILIKIGLETVLNGLIKKEKPKVISKKWTIEQRKKFKATMAKKWKERKKDDSSNL